MRAGNGSERPQEKKDGRRIWLALAGVFAVLILVLVVLNFQKSGFFGKEDSEKQAKTGPAGTQNDNAPANPAVDLSQDTAADGFPDPTQLQALVNDGDSAWIVGHQENFRYQISGAVPTEEIRAAITKSVEETYQDPEVVQNEITVDSSLSGDLWLEGVPELLKSLPLELVDGAFAINNNQTNLVGVAASDDKAQRFKTQASELNMPSIQSSVTVDDRRPPTLVVVATAGKIDLLGSLPEQWLIDKIVADTEALYGQENVTNLIDVDTTTFAGLQLADFGSVEIATFQPLGDFELQLQNGQFSATVREGIAFAPESFELTPETETALDGFAEFFNQTNRPIFIIGHTDDTGDEAENLELSLNRANSVRDFFVSQEVSADRISADGKGETEPIEPNDTVEGQAANRRVEILIGEA